MYPKRSGSLPLNHWIVVCCTASTASKKNESILLGRSLKVFVMRHMCFPSMWQAARKDRDLWVVDWTCHFQSPGSCIGCVCIAGTLIMGQSCCMSLLSWLLLQICLGWGLDDLDVDSVAPKSWFDSKPTTLACGGTNKNGGFSPFRIVPFHGLTL